MAIYPGSYRSGQTGLTVNQLAYAFGGSNPPLPTGDHWVARQRDQRLLLAVSRARSARRLRAFDRGVSGFVQWILSPNSIADIHARVAQGQSTILVRLGSRVQFPSRAPTVPPLFVARCLAFTAVNARRGAGTWWDVVVSCARGVLIGQIGARVRRQIDALAHDYWQRPSREVRADAPSLVGGA